MNSLEKKAFLKVISNLYYKYLVYMAENLNERYLALAEHVHTQQQCPVCLKALALKMTP